MPFCPKCRYEYEPATKTCPDCSEELVAELPPQNADEDLVRVASYMFESDAQMAKLNLERNGVRAVLTNEIMYRTATIPTFANGGIHLLVLESDAERVKQILEG